MLVYLIPNLVTAFTLVTTLSAVLFMFVWSLILCAYIAYRRKRPGNTPPRRSRCPAAC